MTQNIYSYTIKGLLHWYLWILSLVGISTEARKLASFDIQTRDNIHRYQGNNPIIFCYLLSEIRTSLRNVTFHWLTSGFTLLAALRFFLFLFFFVQNIAVWKCEEVHRMGITVLADVWFYVAGSASFFVCKIVLFENVKKCIEWG